MLELGKHVRSALESQRIERVTRDAGQNVGTRAAGTERKHQGHLGRAERKASFNSCRKDVAYGREGVADRLHDNGQRAQNRSDNEPCEGESKLRSPQREASRPPEPAGPSKTGR